MLQELAISNLALIDQVEVPCRGGLNVLTGETGAGKSILMQALALLLGDRADTDKLGRDANKSKTIVEGSFDISHAPLAAHFLAEQDIPVEENQLLLTREVGADGRSKIRINGRLSTVGILRELGSLLVDLHGQHDHQRLLQMETHGEFLDASGNAAHQELLAATRTAFGRWKEAQTQLNQITGDAQQRAQRLDMLSFQLQDIEEVSPQQGEETELQEERERLLNMEKLRDATGAINMALHGDESGAEPGVLALLGQAMKAADELVAMDSRVEQWVTELKNARYPLEDAAAEASSYLDNLDASPQRLEEIEARLHDLGRLKRKYGDSMEAVMAYYDSISKEVAELSLGDEETEALRARCEKLAKEYELLAGKLSRARRQLSQQLAREVIAQLQSLAIPGARFEVDFKRRDEPSSDGADVMEFLFSANPGMPLRPLSKVASGGEISRLMLALRTVLARHEKGNSSQRIPILVFDEIDVGIGGVTAEAVGEKMQELAQTFQVFCITHLPQIARRGDFHLHVKKDADAKSTFVQVMALEGEARVQELARMMGHESTANLQHARQLLKDAAEAKQKLDKKTSK